MLTNSIKIRNILATIQDRAHREEQRDRPFDAPATILRGIGANSGRQGLKDEADAVGRSVTPSALPSFDLECIFAPRFSPSRAISLDCLSSSVGYWHS